MVPGITDGIWAQLGVSDNFRLLDGTWLPGTIGPASTADWIQIDGQVPSGKWAFKRHGLDPTISAMLSPGITNDVMCFTIRLSTSGQQNQPESVTLEFVDTYLDLVLGDYADGTFYNAFPSSNIARRQRHVPLVIPVT